MCLFVRLIEIKVNFSPLMCALSLIFYTYKVKNLCHVTNFVTSIVLECCQSYIGAVILGQGLINSGLETNKTRGF